MLGNQWGFKKGQIAWNKGMKGVRFNTGRTHFKKGMTSWNKGIKTGIKPWLGKKRPEITGENNTEWKGDKVGYWGLHNWVRRHLGTPAICEFCGKAGLTGRQIHWANKSGKYKRDLNDWLRLCRQCHVKYDKMKE